MSKLLLANNATAKINTGIDAIATSIALKTISTTMQTLLAAISATQQALFTIADGTGTVEIIRVTAWTAGTNTITCTRGQNNTTAAPWLAGDAVEVRIPELILDQLYYGEPNNSIVIPREGPTVDISASYSVLIGVAGTIDVNSSSCVGIGSYVVIDASSDQSVAIGSAAWTQAAETVAIGANAYISDAAHTGAIAIGVNAKSSGINSITIGEKGWGTGASSICIGDYADVGTDADYGIAIGKDATAEKKVSIAIGQGTYANGIQSIGIGMDAFTNEDFTIALGSGSWAEHVGACHMTGIPYHRAASAINPASLDAGDILTRHRAAAQMTLASGILNLTSAVSTQAIEIPDGCHFYPDRIDVIIISETTPGGTPKIKVGSFLADIFTLYLGGATGGTYTLGITGNLQTLNYNDTAATIQTALETVFGAGEVSVVIGSNFTITFASTTGDSALIADFTGLTGATSPVLTETQSYNGGTLSNVLTASTVLATTVNGRDRFDVTSPDGVGHLLISTDTAGTGTLTARVFVLGYLVED